MFWLWKSSGGYEVLNWIGIQLGLEWCEHNNPLWSQSESLTTIMWDECCITNYILPNYYLHIDTFHSNKREKKKTVTYHEKDCIQPSTGFYSSVAAYRCRCSYILNKSLKRVIEMMWKTSWKKFWCWRHHVWKLANMAEISKHSNYQGWTNSHVGRVNIFILMPEKKSRFYIFRLGKPWLDVFMA